MFIEIVSISISAIKLEDITVTFQSKAPKNPTIITMETKQLISGNATHLKSLKTVHSINIINAKTPKPKITISFFIKEIMSSAIMGIPLSLISAN